MDSRNYNNIKDSEIRIIGQEISPQEKASKNKLKLWWLIPLSLLIMLGIIIVLLMNRGDNRENSVYLECEPLDTTESQIIIEANSKPVRAYTAVEQKTIDDIPLRLLIPTGGQIEMIVGELPMDDSSILLAAQAADYRADNGQISGAFVYKGELLSRGHPKLGFCAIIGNNVTMGMSTATPLFERAVEASGYFFRQHSLVHNGELGESTPPGKSIRRALCYDGTQLFIVETEGRESLHDFSQALIDMGVQEAISLVGSMQLPLYEDEEGNRIVTEIPHFEGMTETYIVWKN